MKKVINKKAASRTKAQVLAATAKLSKQGKDSLSDTLGIRVSPTFKSWVQGEMAQLGVPERAKAEFLRGCLVFAIKASRRANDPKWVSFATASEDAAIEKLGAKLALEGPRDIAALGFWPT